MDWYNDFQRMVRSDDIGRIIDRHGIRRGKTCRTRQEESVLSVLDAIYASDPSAYPALIRLATIFHAVTPDQMKLIVHVLRGGTFTQYAMTEGVTKAAVGQRWKTAVKRSPLLAKVKRGSNGQPRRILDQRVEWREDAP